MVHFHHYHPHNHLFQCANSFQCLCIANVPSCLLANTFELRVLQERNQQGEHHQELRKLVDQDMGLAVLGMGQMPDKGLAVLGTGQVELDRWQGRVDLEPR